ncbi:hypothetical protein XacyCFBP2565_17615 [Xanthomonas arboricola pv. corylina]|nr:hypothetical protein XacyCFBP2565_17615 [Xanthomonas arboricola pv. corylina]
MSFMCMELKWIGFWEKPCVPRWLVSMLMFEFLSPCSLCSQADFKIIYLTKALCLFWALALAKNFSAQLY